MIECSWRFIGRDSVQDLSRVAGSRRKENNLLHFFRVRKKNLDTAFYIESKEGNSTSKSGQAVTRWGSLWLCGLFRGTSLQIRRCSSNCRTCDSSPGMFYTARWRSGKLRLGRGHPRRGASGSSGRLSSSTAAFWFILLDFRVEDVAKRRFLDVLSSRIFQCQSECRFEGRIDILL